MANDEKSRWIQSHQYNLHSLKVGVTNVYEKDGSLVAKVSVFDPRSRSGGHVTVGAGDEIAVGEQRYRVVEIAQARGEERAWVDVTLAPTLH